MKITKTIATLIAAATLSAQAGNIVCIGINEYTNYSNLEHAENDAATVAKIFASQGHMVTTLIGADASRDAILAALATNPDVVYFAGHGERDRLIAADDSSISLDELAAANATLLLDACFIGSGLKNDGNVKVLAAAKHRAYEFNGHGLFTKHLIDWLTENGEIVADEVSTYVAKKIRRATGGSQKPVLGYI